MNSKSVRSEAGNPAASVDRGQAVAALMKRFRRSQVRAILIPCVAVGVGVCVLKLLAPANALDHRASPAVPSRVAGDVRPPAPGSEYEIDIEILNSGAPFRETLLLPGKRAARLADGKNTVVGSLAPDDMLEMDHGRTGRITAVRLHVQQPPPEPQEGGRFSPIPAR